MTRHTALLALWSILTGAWVASAQSPRDSLASRRDSTRAHQIQGVQVTGRIDDLVGTAATASEGRVGASELRRRPITREGELLESVPGMIVTQHSGEGKANQYFVRGFNLDHGTDFQTQVDGMPVNMPTHGHGQGYTDLNFLMPELVDYLEYRLGVYHAELGDFGSAGGAEFHLVKTLPTSFVTVEHGANALERAALGGSTHLGPGDLLLAGEAKRYDGPWLMAEGIHKRTAVARYSWGSPTSQFSLLGLGYTNHWNSNDQIPARAYESGLISRFGQIDSTDGGQAMRASLSGSWRHIGASSLQQLDLFAIRSKLTLVSDFTYFLDDPVHGDQFAQTDHRTILGGSMRHTTDVPLLGVTHHVTLGLQSRTDLIDSLSLARTERGVQRTAVRSDKVQESGSGLFFQAESRWTARLRTMIGLRGDDYRFHVASDNALNSGTRHAGIVSPKASLVVTVLPGTELYLSGGYGFHSNDARGTTIRVDPVSGEPVDQVNPLVRSKGAELGLRTSPIQGLRTTASLWALDLDSELIFSGDAGATQPSAASHRSGLTVANFYRPRPELSLDADVSVAHAAFRGVEAGQTSIPGALESVFAGGVAWTTTVRGPYGALRLRHFGSYPLIEDNSVRARAATLLSADAGFALTNGTRLQLSALNLGNSRADDIQYFYASRLRGEPTDGVNDVHSHAVEPRQIRLALELHF